MNKASGGDGIPVELLQILKEDAVKVLHSICNMPAPGIHDLESHDGVITHLEPDILECEVKCALGSITMNKASRGDGTPAELF